MFIGLQTLELRSVRFDLDVPAGEIDYDDKVSQSSLLHAQGTAQLLSAALGEIRLKGKLSVMVAAPCDRCLEAARAKIDSDFDLIYMPAAEMASGGEEEVAADAIEVGFYEGNGIELNDVLREVVLLALPMQLVCDEDCKGICPACGQNRNQVDCGCHPQAVDDRWNKLKLLRTEISFRN
jgi:uncharacterized protein